MSLFKNIFGKKEEIPSIQPFHPTQPSSPQSLQSAQTSPMQESKIPSIQTELPEKNISTTVRELEGTPDKAPFFVRIDKFNDAKDNLRMVTKRLKEMDNVLQKIHEVKIKEDEELAAWKEEMKLIRENLAKIDEDLFNKL